MEEIWKDIKGYEGLYQVSNLGRVKSLKRHINDRWENSSRIKKERILKNGVSYNGYCIINLRFDLKQKTYRVHRLVAEAFIPNPDNLPCINHKDEDKTNNRVDNLEWCTYEYNTNYGTRNKRLSEKLINRKDSSKIVIQYDINGNFIKEWNSLREIQRETNMLWPNIRSCCIGKYKQSYGFIWKYKN